MSDAISPLRAVTDLARPSHYGNLPLDDWIQATVKDWLVPLVIRRAKLTP